MQTIDILNTEVGKRKISVSETVQTSKVIDELELTDNRKNYTDEIKKLQEKVNAIDVELSRFDEPEVKAQIEAKMKEVEKTVEEVIV